MIGFSCYTNTDDKIMEAMCNQAKMVARGEAQVPRPFIQQTKQENKSTIKQKVVNGLKIAAVVAAAIFFGKKLIKHLPNIGNKIGPAVKGFGNKVTGFVKNVAKTLPSKVKSIGVKITDFVKNAAKTVPSKVKGIGVKITDFVKNLFKTKKP